MPSLLHYKKRSDIHAARKIWHMTSVSMMAACYWFLPFNLAMGLVLLGWLIFVPVDFLRQSRPELNHFLLSFFRPILRQNEVNKLAGTTFLLTGTALIGFLFPRDIVMLTLLFLAFADPIASYIGIRFGRDKIIGQKSLQGTAAAFFVCAVITFIFLNWRDLGTNRLILLSILGGVSGALAELLPIGSIDDNFTLPVLSSVFLTGIFFAFDLFPLAQGAL